MVVWAVTKWTRVMLMLTVSTIQPPVLTFAAAEPDTKATATSANYSVAKN